jgi:4-amino-4-deoxy-L-arabinose transferase-like glycosyltransferase
MRGRREGAVQPRTTILLWLALILIIAFAIRLVPIHTSYLFWDETVYVQHAMILAGDEASYEEFSLRPILLPSIISLYRFVVPNDVERFARFVAAALAALGVIVAYAIGSMIDHRTGLIAGAVYSVLPMHVLFSRSVMTDVASAVLMGASVFVLIRWFERPGFTLSGYLASGALLALAILMKFSSGIILPVLVLAMLIWRRPTREVILGTAAIISSALLVMSPFLIWSQARFGAAYAVFLEGARAISTTDPVSGGFLMLTIIGCFSFLLIFIGYMLYRAVRWYVPVRRAREHGALSENRRLVLFLFAWFAVSIAYYLVVVHGGVAKPSGIEWEIIRFLMPAVLPGIVLAAAALSRLKWWQLVGISAIFVLMNVNAYQLAYEDPILHEDGLRTVSKDAALFARDALPGDAVIAADNWPVVAYYSGHAVRRPEARVSGDYRLLLVRMDAIPIVPEPIARFTAGSWVALVIAPEERSANSSVVTEQIRR